MPRKSSARPSPAAVSERVDNRLKTYGAAAIAAGVSVLSLGAPAEANVVITRKTIPIPVGEAVSIDLNHDGITDFQFNLASTFPACTGHASLVTMQRVGDAVIGGPIGTLAGPYASALVKGAKIGPSAHFAGAGGFAHIESSFFEYCSGSDSQRLGGHWGGNATNRYLGVKFLIRGKTHYGWIRLTVNFPSQFGAPRTATITGYAYETVANKRITAGSTSDAATRSEMQQDSKSRQPSLGMLARGAESVPFWRR
jgi:hypothetical protein